MDIQVKVGEIVSADIRTAHVFKKHGIDFCCGGGISLEKACEKQHADLENVVADLEKTLSIKSEEVQNFEEWNPAELCDYIEEKHHTYVKEALPMLKAYAEKVASVHGHHHTELVALASKVNLLVDDLAGHLQKEEIVLFPWIRRAAEADDSTEVSVPFGQFNNPVSMMESDHEEAGELMAEMREMTKDYFLPEYACNTWRAYFHLLQEFEDDLHMHIHLENNVLHKKARAFDAVAKA